ncbi:MAG TPA: cation transporter [Gammaproteobacteria bacterium]|nr:cation transporter [Gammaproteobacteria bacterium]
MMRIEVEGMTCDHCEKAVKKALGEVPGVERVVSVDRNKGEAVVEGTPGQEALVSAIEEEGYEARVA